MPTAAGPPPIIGNRSPGHPRAVQEPIPILVVRLQERPRALQEGSKRLSEGFRVEDAIRNPFWTHFWHQKESSGLKKIIKILATVGDFSGFAIFSLDRFRTSFFDLPGLLLGGYLASRQAETGLLGGLGPSKSRSPITFLGPGGVQERSKRPAGGQNKAPCFGAVLGTALGGGRPPQIAPFWDALGMRFWRKISQNIRAESPKPSQKLKPKSPAKS